MHRYNFNGSQLRALLDADMFRVDMVHVTDRTHVLLTDGDVFHVGGEWLDDNNNAEDLNND